MVSLLQTQSRATPQNKSIQSINANHQGTPLKQRSNLLGTRPDKNNPTISRPSEATAPPPSTAPSIQSSTTRLFVNNLSPFINDSILRKHIEQYVNNTTDITDCRVIKHKNGISRRIAYIGCKTSQSTDVLYKQLQNTYIGTCKIQVKYATVPIQQNKDSTTSNTSQPTQPTPRIDFSQLRARDANKLRTQLKLQRRSELFLLGLPDDIRNKLKHDDKFDEFMRVHGYNDMHNTTQQREKQLFWSNDDSTVLNKYELYKATNESQLDKLVDNTESSDDEYQELPNDIDDSQSVARDPIVHDTTIDDKSYFHSKQANWSDDDNGFDDQPSATGNTNTVDHSTEQANELQHSDIEYGTAENNVDNVSIKDDTDIDTLFDKTKKGSAESTHGIHPSRIQQVDSTNTDSNPTNNPNNSKTHDTPTTAEKYGRLFLIQLPYSTTVDDLTELLQPYNNTDTNEDTVANITEVHLVTNEFNQSKGCAYVQFADHAYPLAEQCRLSLNNTIYQGRHIKCIAARPKLQSSTSILIDHMSDEQYASLTYKQQQELLMKQNAAKHSNSLLTQNKSDWNTLFLRSDTVLHAAADKLQLKHNDIMDITANNLAVRQAVSEQQILQETKKFLSDNDVSLDAFTGNRKSTPRSNTVILVKNLPYDTNELELNNLFAPYGTLLRLILPSTRAVAIIEYDNKNHAVKAFTELYSKPFKRVPLMLEWAPINTFNTSVDKPVKIINNNNTAELIQSDTIDENTLSHTLYIGNLSFNTTESTLRDLFQSCGELRTVTIARHNKHGQQVSNGYGFIEYKYQNDMSRALKLFQHRTIDGHTIQLKISNMLNSNSNHSNRPQNDSSHTQSKLIVLNLPFEANVNELNELFSKFGQLKHKPRIPKKSTGTTRGFAFIDFISSTDAANALNSLHGIHFYGRRLNIEYAKHDDTSTINSTYDQLNNNIDSIRHKTKQQYQRVQHAEQVAQQNISKRRKINDQQDNDNYDIE